MFAWTQNRCVLPAWYGCGTAFGVPDVDELRRLYRDWAFFRTLVHNLEMTLAKSSMEIAREYLTLVSDDRLWEPIAGRACAHGRGGARDRRDRRSCSTASRSCSARSRLRNPYVDPMNAIQVALLRRYRAGDEAAEPPLLRSIAGISAALRNTG